jgi:hypothetical protein
MGQYTVQGGDSYFGIAKRLFGNERYAEQIVQMNGVFNLRPGMVLNVPDSISEAPRLSNSTWNALTGLSTPSTTPASAADIAQSIFNGTATTAPIGTQFERPARIPSAPPTVRGARDRDTGMTSAAKAYWQAQGAQPSPVTQPEGRLGSVSTNAAQPVKKNNRFWDTSVPGIVGAYGVQDVPKFPSATSPKDSLKQTVPGGNRSATPGGSRDKTIQQAPQAAQVPGQTRSNTQASAQRRIPDSIEMEHETKVVRTAGGFTQIAQKVMAGEPFANTNFRIVSQDLAVEALTRLGINPVNVHASMYDMGYILTTKGYWLFMGVKPKASPLGLNTIGNPGGPGGGYYEPPYNPPGTDNPTPSTWQVVNGSLAFRVATG